MWNGARSFTAAVVVLAVIEGSDMCPFECWPGLVSAYEWIPIIPVIFKYAITLSYISDAHHQGLSQWGPNPSEIPGFRA